jgi:hypothetical protein
MMRVPILSLVCLLIGCSGGVLPSERALLELEDAKLRDMVLQHVPLGSPRKAVEQTFSQSFRKKYTVVDYESPELVSKRWFSVPVVTGDYYLRSDVASKMSGLGTCRVATVFLLFDSTGRLKDVAASKWTDSI